MKFSTKFRLLLTTLFALAGVLCAQAQNRTVSGVVKDAHNEPVIGASVFTQPEGGERLSA